MSPGKPFALWVYQISGIRVAAMSVDKLTVFWMGKGLDIQLHIPAVFVSLVILLDTRKLRQTYTSSDSFKWFTKVWESYLLQNVVYPIWHGSQLRLIPSLTHFPQPQISTFFSFFSSSSFVPDTPCPYSHSHLCSLLIVLILTPSGSIMASCSYTAKIQQETIFPLCPAPPIHPMKTIKEGFRLWVAERAVEEIRIYVAVRRRPTML